MTEVWYYQKGDRFRIRFEGHATGSDEVCAAVSSLVYAMAGYLENQAGRNTTVQRMELAEGQAEILFTTRDKQVKGAWEMMVFGLRQLAHNFRDYIRVLPL